MSRQDAEIALSATPRPAGHPSGFRKWVALAVLSLAVVLGACREERVENPNFVDEAAMAQDLLIDHEEIEDYLKDFPQQAYRIVEVPRLGKFYIDGNPALVKRALRAGRRWEPEVQAVMALHARPGSTALDVGAHIGSHTLWLARLVGPEGAVYAFEPQKKIYRELVKNLELNAIQNVVPLRFAVGSRHGVIEMSPAVGRDGLMHVGRGGDQAELRAIDSFGFSNVSMIKVDVEGFEASVLMGAEQTLRTWHPAIIVEILQGESYAEVPPKAKARIDSVRQILDRFGYELTLISCDGGCDYLGLYTESTTTQ